MTWTVSVAHGAAIFAAHRRGNQCRNDETGWGSRGGICREAVTFPGLLFAGGHEHAFHALELEGLALLTVAKADQRKGQKAGAGDKDDLDQCLIHEECLQGGSLGEVILQLS